MSHFTAHRTEAPATVPVLVITGPVGVGKSSVASALADLLSNANLPNALIDMDWLRWCYPSPADDPFNGALGLQNLAALWVNYRAAGIAWVILVDVVETRAMIAEYQAAIPGAQVTIVRLHATVPTLHQRLAGRETGANLTWHQNRAIELAEQMEHTALEDLRVETEGKSIAVIAQEVLAQIQWAPLTNN